MKDVIDAISFAKSYLKSDELPGTVLDYKLNRHLQYYLCASVERIIKCFKEITYKDVALIIEAWTISHTDLHPLYIDTCKLTLEQLLEHKNEYGIYIEGNNGSEMSLQEYLRMRTGG